MQIEHKTERPALRSAPQSGGYALGSGTLKRLGIPDRWIEHGFIELYAECGFDEAALIAAAKEMLAEQKAMASAHNCP